MGRTARRTQEDRGAYDVLRRKYLAELGSHTNRNVIVYYSGWLQKPELYQQHPYRFNIHDNDKNGLMATIHHLDRSKGLDLLLHTPGGDFAATESLVHYLRQMFKTDVRAIVPQLAMSGGTMIALACKEIWMGEHSNIGPIDPQFGGIPAHGVIEEFEQAKKEVLKNPTLAHLWQPIIAKYQPTLIGECQKAIKWSEQMVKDWLLKGMLKGDNNATEKANRIIDGLGSHALTLSHARHISLEGARNLGVKVCALEGDIPLRDAVLSVHHACIHTLTSTGAVKIIENQNGEAFIQSLTVSK
ncbi:MAG: S49 family peptidase [Planctomycetota bacterium]